MNTGILLSNISVTTAYTFCKILPFVYANYSRKNEEQYSLQTKLKKFITISVLSHILLSILQGETVARFSSRKA